MTPPSWFRRSGDLTTPYAVGIDGR